MTSTIITKKDVHDILNHAQRSLDYYKVKTTRLRRAQQVLDKAYPLLEAAPALRDSLAALLKLCEAHMKGIGFRGDEALVRAAALLEQIKGDTP